MTVFVTGATGVLGRRLVETLTDRGHDVVGLARDEAGAATIEQLGGTATIGDLLEPESLEPPAADVVVHAATAIPTTRKPSEAEWARNDRVRLEGARTLVETIGEEVERFCFPSVVWVARQPDGSAFDETAPRNPDRATRSAATVETFLAAAEDDHDFERLVCRLGLLYSPDGAMTRQIGAGLLDRSMPIVGRGLLGRRDGRLSRLHADDAAAALVTAIEAECSGLYHVVDEEPVTMAAFLEHFADLLEAPSPRRIPAWLARFLIGRELTDGLTKPMPTTSDRFQATTGWEPSYPTYRDGLAQVRSTWEETGILAATGEGYEWVGDVP